MNRKVEKSRFPPISNLPSRSAADLLKRESESNVRDELLRQQEQALSKRERDLQLREGLLMLQYENWSAQRAQANSVTLNTNVAQENRIFDLQEAYEKLARAAAELQTKAEEAEKSKLEITHLATHDFLTELPNRRQLNDLIIQAIALAKRRHENMAVLFLDIDHFKDINDTLGHIIGDQLLKAVAKRIQNAIRKSDIVCRHGGDEFILVMSQVGPNKALALIVKKIHEAITSPYCEQGVDLKIGVSIGISIYPHDGKDAATLIGNADSAMYQAKNGGRNRFQFFEKANSSSSEE